MILKTLSDLIPLLEKHSPAQIGKMLKPKRSRATIYSYMKQLRDAGYKLPTRKAGRPKIPLDNRQENI